MAKKITQIEINGETYNVGGSGESVSGNFINQVDDFSQYVPTKWNEIAQYVGTDTPQYKNGYFYKNSGSWIIPADSQQIAYQSITESGEHAIPIVSPLYEGLSSPVFVGSNAYYGMLSGNTPTVGGKIFDFLTGTINTITAVTDNGDETYICVTDGGAREETTTYTLDMTEEFDYTERVDAYKNRFIVIEYTDISDYPSSMLGFYIVEETDPNTGTLVENYYPAGLNGCVVTRTTAPVVIDRGTWTRIDVQPTSSSGGSNALVGFILANNKVSIVPLVDCYIENGNLYDPTTHEQLYPTSDTYYYEINEEKVYTPDESYELVDVTNSVLIQPSVNQIVIEIRGNEAFRWNGLSYNQIVDSTKAPDVPTFTEASTRANLIGSGESTTTLWGKIKKWLSDLKDLAFIDKPSSGQTTTYLRGDGTWQEPPNTTYSLSATNEKVTLTPSQGSVSNVSLNTLINGLSTGDSDPQDNDYIISQYVNGGTTTTTYHRRPLSKFWNWIKTKLGIGTNNGTFLRKDGTWATPTDTKATVTTTGSGNAITSLTASNGALTATKGSTFLTSHQDISGKVSKSGDSMSGQLKTSFNDAVAMGSYQAHASTIPNLCSELRYSSGCCGSVNIETAYTLSNITISTGWYNFLWIPHRSGGVNGMANGDNCNYGSLYLSGMTVSGCYMIRFSSSSIAELRNLYADTNTWRPLGTGASDACAGNDSRLSNSRPASDVYAWAKSASLAAAMNGAISSGSVTTCASGTCNISWYQIGDIVIFTGYIKPNNSSSTSGSVVATMPGTYKRKEYFAGIQTNKSAVFRLTTTGYIENEGPVVNDTYYFQVVGIKVV